LPSPDKDKIFFELAWYQNRCSNQLIDSRLPGITGFTSVTINQNATVQNTGIESTVRAKLVSSKGFEWAFSFNIGLNRNKLIAFPNLAKSPYASIYVIGQSLNIEKYIHFTGVDPNTGKYTYLDKNHDGVINTDANDTANDLFSRDRSTKFDGGIENSFYYKGFQLSFFFNFRNQPSATALFGLIPGTIGSIPNQSVDVLNRWQKPGDIAKYARFTTRPVSSDYQLGLSDAIFSNGSFIRLRNVSLSYDLPSKIIEKAFIKNCKVYVRGENLFVISKYKGIDPETMGVGLLPPSKVFTAGLQFVF